MKKRPLFLAFASFCIMAFIRPGMAAADVHPSLYMSGSFSTAFTGSKDVAQIYQSDPSFGPSSQLPEGLGLAGDLKLGYQFGLGLALESGYEYFGRESRMQSATANGSYSSGGGYSDTWDSSESSFTVEGLYRLRLSKHWLLDAGLESGLAFEHWVISYDSAYAASYDGQGAFATPELRLELQMGKNTSMDFGAGYRFEFSGPLTNSQGQILTVSSASGSPKSWVPNNSGLDLRLGMNIYFNGF